MAALLDRSIRNLVALSRSASTSRVINLVSVQKASEDGDEYRTSPFFLDRVLNTAIVVKHRVRSYEQYVFAARRSSAVKLIVPFDAQDLRLGGRSLMVGQRGWEELLRSIMGDQKHFERDVRVLQLLTEIPSLDPFLLREHLRRHDVSIARCYFALSEADSRRMEAFVAEEVVRLVRLAYENARDATDPSVARMVAALLSTRVDDRLEPLRATLRMDQEEFSEGVFSWKGFLYYKWSVRVLWPQVTTALKELRQVRITGSRDAEMQVYVNKARHRLARTIVDSRREVLDAVQVYDDSFYDLTSNGRPQPFREFLLRAPEMFSLLGERLGAISHIVSFWRYRFSPGAKLQIPLDELVDLLEDFEASLDFDGDPPAAFPDQTLIYRAALGA